MIAMTTHTFRPAHYLPAALALAIEACTAEAVGPVVNPGVAGAGVKTEIVAVDHDSTGYTVRFRMTNRDTADVGFSACTGAVEVPADTGWVPVTNWGQCPLWLGGLPPATSITLSIPRQTLVEGSQIRVALDWTFVVSRGGARNLSTSDPIIVP
jgi:hypothetical protein